MSILDKITTAVLPILVLTACAPGSSVAPVDLNAVSEAPTYLIGPGDGLQIYVWENPDLTTNVTVRPDGRLSVPLLNDVIAADKTPVELADDIQTRLSEYVRDPLVTVIVTNFVSSYSQQVRVVGATTRSQGIPFRKNMSLLDAMIEVGGLTEFAAGNRARLVRTVGGEQREFGLRVDDLLNRGDITANVQLLPGDVIIVPESSF